MKNGRLLLVELFAFCNGKSNPSSMCFAGRDFKLFKGSLEDRLLSAKKYYTEEKGFSVMEEVTLGIIKDIVVGSQMSVHQNVLKLLRRCLETKYPIISTQLRQSTSSP